MGISREQALECFRSDDLIGLGMEADAVRRRLHPEGVVTYAVGCSLDCAALLGGGAGAEARVDAACAEIEAAVRNGATSVRLLSGADVVRDGMYGPAWIEGVLRELRRRVPAAWIEGLPAAKVAEIAVRCGISGREVIARMRDAGLDAIAGDGPELNDTAGVARWIDVHRAAHGVGMRTCAEMIFGAGETAEQRVDSLEAVRRLQEETGGFAAFVPTAAPAPNGRQLDSVTAVERLKTLAVARMFLDTIENVQADGAASGIDGLKVLQTALRFGANDAGTVMVAGDRLPSVGTSEEDLRRIIRDAGFRPAERDAAYRAMMVG